MTVRYMLALVTLLALALLLVAGIGVPAVQAATTATFTVDNTADATDADPGDGLCQTSAGTCTLRAAVQEANALDGPDEIILPADTYVLTIEGADDDAAAGDLDVTDDLTIIGADAAMTIVDGDGTHRVFHLIGAISLDLSHVTIRNGFTDDIGGGAGIYNPNGALSVTSSILRGNETEVVNGGGIHNEATLVLSNTTVVDNTAGRGAGVANDGGGVLTATASTFTGNAATEFGGGLFTSGDAILENITISGNDADSNGGGIYVGIATITVTNGTVVSNTVTDVGTGSGGGIRNVAGTVTLKNTIVADNADDNCDGTAVTSAGHNLEDADTCDFDATGDQMNTDPMLGPLADNGGPTPTHALLSGSPAIDAGDDGACPDTDQRGVSRPADGDFDGAAICDIGAFEYAPVVHTLYVPTVLKQ